ncbi:MAG: HAMP domain-containing sensor histidine kinase [Pelolinea sp.]|nr:HAMP domain-containing sensor histidine kinase [Pelolinea sp.]
MLKTIRKHFALKILLAFIAVAIFSTFILAAVMSISIESTYDKHIGKQLTSEGQQGTPGGGRGSTLYKNFKAAVNESLLFSIAAALMIAGISSVLISRQITKPLRSITHASHEIAKGNFDQRVDVKASEGGDELIQLGYSFNQMAEQLEQNDKMRRQLVGDISHELRTPLTAIKGSMEGLIDGVLVNDESTYNQIYQEADRLQRLVEDLQELNRLEGSAFKIEKKKIKVADLIQNAFSPLSNNFNKNGIQVTIQSEKNLPSIMADHDRMVQVIQNLLGNALQFTSENGVIEIRAQKTGDYIQVSVKDDGAGIETNHLPYIFDRFYRADRSRSRQNGGGSGIGLTIAQSLVEAHGGKIWAASEGKGKGSTFTFTIPA